MNRQEKIEKARTVRSVVSLMDREHTMYFGAVIA